uniref:Uncharacterized protein n=1 Tax=Chenopodium quinoa TaxID=63459 RepID=A0A803MK60_CHEQI
MVNQAEFAALIDVLKNINARLDKLEEGTALLQQELHNRETTPHIRNHTLEEIKLADFPSFDGDGDLDLYLDRERRMERIFAHKKLDDHKRFNHAILKITRNKEGCTLPCVMFGDFNKIVCQAEKEGGVPRSERLMDAFRNTIDDCGLRDLGYKESNFTWKSANTWANATETNDAMRLTKYAESLSSWAARTLSKLKKNIKANEENLRVAREREPDAAMLDECSLLVSSLNDARCNDWDTNALHTLLDVEALLDTFKLCASDCIEIGDDDDNGGGTFKSCVYDCIGVSRYLQVIYFASMGLDLRNFMILLRFSSSPPVFPSRRQHLDVRPPQLVLSDFKSAPTLAASCIHLLQVTLKLGSRLIADLGRGCLVVSRCGGPYSRFWSKLSDAGDYTSSGGDFDTFIEDEDSRTMGQQAAKRLEAAQRKGKSTQSDHNSEALSVARSIEETSAQSTSRLADL